MEGVCSAQVQAQNTGKEQDMIRSRRDFLKMAAVTATFASLPAQAAGAATHFGARHGIAKPFDDLPGDLGFKIHAPSRKGKPGFTVQANADKVLFAASAIKTFALCEALRQADSPDIDNALETKELPLDARVWSPGSPIFNPPNLSGVVSERTALEAMILRSDNTATDMIFNLAGVDNIRRLIASAGLVKTRVPDNTRIFAGYVFGAENYKTITWDELLKLASEGRFVNPFLNDVETLASTAEEFVTYYAQALQGDFFQHGETLQEFRRILTLCDFIYLIPVPLGVSVYAKSGNVDFPDFHARAFAGGMFFGDQWVYFAFILNWYAPEGDDPQTVEKFFAAIHEALTRVRDALA
jgi:beta-lactamase class A